MAKASKKATKATAKKATKATTKKAPVVDEFASSPRVVAQQTFNERVKQVKVVGETLRSRMVRVDADFADFLRDTAKKQGTSITEISRAVHQSVID